MIVITTKRGKAGLSKPQIVLNTNISAQSMSREFKHQQVYAQGNAIDKGYDPTSSQSWGPKIADLANDPGYGGNTDNQYTQASGKHQGMYYNTKRVAAGLDGWTTPETYDNLYDYLQTGCTENTNLSISQALANVNYSFSISNSHQDGIIPSTGMDRWGGRGVVDWTINKEWKTGFSANYSSSEITSAPGANNGIMNVLYSCPAEYNLKGIPYCSPSDPTQQILFRSTSFNNPYWWSANDEFGQHTNRFFGNAYFEYAPNIGLEGFTLKFREQAGIDMWTSNYSKVAEIGSAYNKKGEIENYGSQHNVFNNTFTANLDGRINEDWGLNIILGNEVNHENKRIWDYDGTNFNFYGFPVMSNVKSIAGGEENVKRYILQRFLQLIPVLIGITFLSFAMMRIAGSDAITELYGGKGAVAQEIIDQKRAELGLDRPFVEQYFSWLGGMLTGDMGTSYVSGRDVFKTFVSKLPATLLLTALSILATVLISIPLGVLAAVRHDRFTDYLLRFLSFIGNSLPNFFVALLLMQVLSIRLGWLPVISSGTGFKSAVMPTLTLAIAMSAKYMRQVRATVLEELNKDYVTGAQARGVRGRVILWRSVLKASMLTIITLLALSIGSLLGGTAIIESIFMWDGVGKLAVDAITMRDYPLIQAYVVWMAIIYVLVNLVTDLLYHALDPRIRLGVSR